MGMEQRLSLVTLGVADLVRSRRFYEAGLGWRASGASTESVAFFQLGGIALALWSREALAEDARLPGPGSVSGNSFGGIALAHNVRTRDEVDTVLARAQAAGGHVLRPAEDAFWGGCNGYFADPDGHLWEVAWNPHFTLRDDGSLQLPA
jgi:catechol 2,3-dioxygenase-like lactoylglutathione lyase family enzyme